ncbi:MAG: hypothetical protein H6598_09555 [Flavobacteriales bacterium]|nr:hypothetical protein [Flavobacteriales bacterium]
MKQKKMIESHFDCFKCHVDRNGLTCTGFIQPDIQSAIYKIQIKYSGNGAPKVFIKTPIIEKNSKIHRYSDGSLCLYYPLDDPWSDKKNIHDTIIPWTAEWLVYYELFLLTGKWLGPEQPHGKKKIQED